jgi:GTPase SAR1 family protein
MPHLPPFLFLIGPPKCGKTTLVNLLCERDSSIAHCSFDEPIREATLQIFFPEQLHMGIDLREDDALQTQLPFTAITIAMWMSNLRRTLTGISPTLLGDIAKKLYTGALSDLYIR